MNFILYLVIWAAIGLLAGFIANWISEHSVWPWFWVDLSAGFAGAVGGGYFLTLALFGMSTVLSGFSLLFATLGALALLALEWILRKAFS